MKILETGLQFNGLKKRSSTKRAIIHHTASGDVSAATIHGWHRNQGWAGIGYHFVIRTSGAIERGRSEWSIGAHSGPQGNGDSIGIVLTGNFENGKPTAAQIDALVWLIKDYLIPKYGQLQVIGHKDVMPTACPGKNFPWSDLKNRLEEKQMPEVPAWKKKIMDDAAKAGLIDPAAGHAPDEPATKWFVLAVGLNLLRALKGG